MAHKKAQGATSRTVNTAGKRRGVKKFGDETVNIGTIIVRQKGTKFHPGKNVGMGKDFTIYAKQKGKVAFRKMINFHRGQKYVDIIPETEKKTKSAK